jgi:hypothetical protein
LERAAKNLKGAKAGNSVALQEFVEVGAFDAFKLAGGNGLDTGFITIAAE